MSFAHKMLLALLLSSLYQICAVPPTAEAATWHVNPISGINAPTCGAESAPCRTLQYTIDRAGEADTIFAAAGTYSMSSNVEAFPIQINGKSIIILGQSSASTIVDASGSGQSVFRVSGMYKSITLKFMTVQGGFWGIEYWGNAPFPINGEVTGNHITGNLGAIFLSYAPVSVNQNAIDWNTNVGISVSHSTAIITRNALAWNGDGVYIVDTPNLRIVNNLIAWNTGSGVYNRQNANPTVTNNTIAYNSQTGIINMLSSSSTTTNNIIVGNTKYGISDDGTGASVNTYNDVWGNGWGSYSLTSGGAGSISADPLFVSLFDGHLLCGSPAVNSGSSSAPLVPTDDYDGNARPVAGMVDMGAYEKLPDPNCITGMYLPLIRR